MIKASALYMVIIIALVIGVLCSSLIVTAYYYRLQYQKIFRYSVLQNNLGSGVNILLAGSDNGYYKKTFSLFNDDADTVDIEKMPWGVFDIGIVKAFIQHDTLYKTFSIANTVDSTKWAALYLADDGRPVSLSGKTVIRGNVFLPKSGIKQAYMDNNPYQGDKRLVIGNIKTSQNKLLVLDSLRLQRLKALFNQQLHVDTLSLTKDSISNSFLNPTKFIYVGDKTTSVNHIKLNGNIILLSDTLLTIDSTAQLTNVVVVARSIAVHSGFIGKCQLYAQDTIGIARNSKFEYPSCAGILRFKSPSLINTQEKISLHEKCAFSGLIFTYEETQNPFQPLIHIEKETVISGQVYSQGTLDLKDYIEIRGSVFTAKFQYRTDYTLYENYLNNIKIDSKSLPPYYLSSELIPVASPKRKVLQWLEAN